MIDQGHVLDGINEVFNMIKRKEYNQAQERMAAEIDQFFQKEIVERRKKVTALNQTIFQLNLMIKKITTQYNAIKKDCPDAVLSSIEEYLLQLKREKINLETKKRHTSRN